jgi:hypothetical protein
MPLSVRCGDSGGGRWLQGGCDWDFRRALPGVSYILKKIYILRWGSTGVGFELRKLGLLGRYTTTLAIPPAPAWGFCLER